MNEDEFLNAIGIIFVATVMIVMVFAFARGTISSPTYNYTDYCVDNFGDNFISSNSGMGGIKRCYKIDDGVIVEKFFKQYESHITAECEEVGFWELDKWNFTYCNWDDAKRDLSEVQE